MILEVVKYGHPALRQKGARIEAVNGSIKELIADMFETMYAAKGVGLAAQQIGQVLELTVIDVRGITDRPSTLEQDEKLLDVQNFMPLALINPEVKPLGETVTGGEGCLSFPEIFAEIPRCESAVVKALNGLGKPIEFRCGGLLARVIQHEVDHLKGILFIDRMASETKQELKPQLDELQAATRAELKQAKVQ